MWRTEALLSLIDVNLLVAGTSQVWMMSLLRARRIHHQPDAPADVRGLQAVDKLDDVIQRLWGDAPHTIDVLGGGITNHNVKVTFEDGSQYVVRIVGENTGLLGIDRMVEYEASLAAAAVGVGPQVFAFVEPEGFLVTRFIDGVTVPIESMQQPETIRRVAHALRAIHAGPSLPARFDSFEIVESYRSIAFSKGVELPPAYATARQVARQIEEARGAVPERPCHNDLLNANFIDDGGRIRIVDWEYAGMGDIFFDFANFSINHSLDEQGRRLLLEAYFGTVRADQERALTLMRYMSDFREAMWGVVQSAVSSLDFDFAGYATEHFERLERIAAEDAFRAALAPS